MALTALVQAAGRKGLPFPERGACGRSNLGWVGGVVGEFQMLTRQLNGNVE